MQNKNPEETNDSSNFGQSTPSEKDQVNTTEDPASNEKQETSNKTKNNNPDKASDPSNVAKEKTKGQSTPSEKGQVNTTEDPASNEKQETSNKTKNNNPDKASDPSNVAKEKTKGQSTPSVKGQVNTTEDPASNEKQETSNKTKNNNPDKASDPSNVAKEKTKGQSNSLNNKTPDKTNASSGSKGQSTEEKSPPWIVSYQKWVIIGIGVLYAATIVMIVVIWNLSSNVQLDTTNSVPQHYDQYILKTDFEKQLNNVEEMKKTIQDFKKEWKVPQHEWGIFRNKEGNMLEDFTETHHKNGKTTEGVEDMRYSMELMVSDIEKLKYSADEVSETTTKLNQEMKQVVHNMENRMNENIKGVKESFESEYKVLAKKSHNQLEQYENQFNEQIQYLKTEHNTKLEAVEKALKTDFGAKYDKLDPLVQAVIFKVEDVIMPNFINKQNVAGAVVVAMVGVVVFYFIQRGNTAHTYEKSHNGRVITQSMVDVPPLRRKVPNVSLQNAICVVSFNETTQEHHKQLVNQVVQGMSPRLREKCPLHYYIVRNHDHIDRLQPAKLYLLFDNFSERHVIIEEPGIGQGDLKRTTVHAISQLQADYMIIYVRDPGSKGLTAHARYNKDIYSVKSHEVLRMLNQRGRFFSVFDRLSEFQIASIQAIINDTF